MSGSPPKGFSSEGYVSRPDSESAQPGDGVALSARAAQKIQVRDVGAHVDACADADGADGVSQVHAGTHSWRSDDISKLILITASHTRFFRQWFVFNNKIIFQRFLQQVMESMPLFNKLLSFL